MKLVKQQNFSYYSNMFNKINAIAAEVNDCIIRVFEIKKPALRELFEEFGQFLEGGEGIGADGGLRHEFEQRPGA